MTLATNGVIGVQLFGCWLAACVGTLSWDQLSNRTTELNMGQILLSRLMLSVATSRI